MKDSEFKAHDQEEMQALMVEIKIGKLREKQNPIPCGQFSIDTQDRLALRSKR